MLGFLLGGAAFCLPMQNPHSGSVFQFVPSFLVFVQEHIENPLDLHQRISPEK